MRRARQQHSPSWARFTIQFRRERLPIAGFTPPSFKALPRSSKFLRQLTPGPLPPHSSNLALTVTGGAAVHPQWFPVTPSPGTGAALTAQTFTYAFADSNGFADISYTDTMLTGTGGSANSRLRLLYPREQWALSVQRRGHHADGPGHSRHECLADEQPMHLERAQFDGERSGQHTDRESESDLCRSCGFSRWYNSLPNFGYVQNNGGQNSGFVNLGSWSISVGPPTVTSVTPNSGSGLGPVVFSYVYNDPNGYGDISYAYSLISPNGSGVNACFVAFFPASNAFYLVSDDGTGLLAAVTGGSATTSSNSQCTLTGSGSGSSGTGNNLTVSVELNFAAGFAGAKSNYGYAANAGGQNSGFQDKGTWNP